MTDEAISEILPLKKKKKNQGKGVRSKWWDLSHLNAGEGPVGEDTWGT